MGGLANLQVIGRPAFRARCLHPHPDADKVRLICKLLLLNVLAACGAPGSDEVFTKGMGKPKAFDTASFRPARSAAQRTVTRTYGGYFRRVGNHFEFQPCDTKVPLVIFTSPQARLALRERTRFNDVWEDAAKRFAVFQGAIVTDTPDTKGVQGDSAKPGPRTRFYLTAVDSLRTWRSTDCGGMRVS